jgi:peptidoglycan/LPS O-acetylase OafA/YrhL
VSQFVWLGLILGLLGLFWCYSWLGLRFGEPDASIEIHRRFAAIDGLRGTLALSVFVHHALCSRTWYSTGVWGCAGNSVLAQAGIAAVTLFFFITGFLFWTKLRKQPRLRFLLHLRSRVTRLTPAYWAAIAVVLLVVGFRTGWKLQVAPANLLQSLSSWVFFTVADQKDINGFNGTFLIIAGVPWTLVLEWVFYLLVPFLSWFAFGIFRTVLFLGITYAAWRFFLLGDVQSFLPATPRYLATQGTFHFTRTFGGGMLVAALLPWIQSHVGRIDFKRPVFSLISLGGVLAVLRFSHSDLGFRESLPLLVPFALVVLGNDWFGFLTSRPSQFLGQISYSTYLMHGVVLHLSLFAVNRLFPVSAIPGYLYWLLIGALGAVVLAVAARWYRWFEAPFLSHKVLPEKASLLATAVKQQEAAANVSS